VATEKHEERKNEERKEIDPYEVSARFLLTNEAMSDFRKSLGPLLSLLEKLINDLEKKHYNPSCPDVDRAKELVKTSNMKFAGPADVACPVCTINGNPHYGLSKSQCIAQGGKCTGHGPK
jgi:hypothetical protein